MVFPVIPCYSKSMVEIQTQILIIVLMASYCLLTTVICCASTLTLYLYRLAK